MVSAKTEAEAIEKAVRELGAPSADAIEYVVLEQAKKGLFGIGAADAKISATYNIKGVYAALDMIENVVKDMGLDAKVCLAKHEGDEALITVDGEGAGILIGHHGETLDAIQYLVNLALYRKANQGGSSRENIKITVDIENYRAKREETLRALARRMAAKALRNKRSVMLEPMSAYERRIIHSEIQGIEGVSTNSIGSDNNRKIVIFLTDKKPKELFDEPETGAEETNE